MEEFQWLVVVFVARFLTSAIAAFIGAFAITTFLWSRCDKKTGMTGVYAEIEEYGVRACRRGHTQSTCPWDTRCVLGKHWVIGWQKQRDNQKTGRGE